MRHVVRALWPVCTLAISLIGCGQKEQTSQVTIAVPSEFSSPASRLGYSGKGSPGLLSADAAQASATLATFQTRLVSVNVSSGGVATVKPVVWMAQSEGDTPPKSIIVEQVPRGTQQLIQVLIAAEDVSNQSLSFFYGDTAKTFLNPEEPAEVLVSNIGGAQFNEVNISGRYLRANGTGPTGRMNVRFSPAAGKPEMALFQKEIFAGWFDIFALEAAQFRFVMEDGEEIFPSLNGLSNVFYLADQPYRNMRVKIPAAWRPNYETSDPTDREPLEAQRLVVGFFGPGAGTANKAVCYSPTAEPISEVWQASTGSAPLIWAGATPPVAGEAGVERAGSSNVQGGKPATDAMCLASGDRQLYRDYLRLAHQEIRNRDRLLGFSGPFALKAEASREYATATWAANKISLQWKYLPGIKDTNASSGVTVYSRLGYDNHDSRDFRSRNDDGLKCGELDTLKDLSAKTDYAVPVEAGEIAGVSSTVWSSRKVQIAICPYQTGADGKRTYYKSGLYVYLQGGGGTVASAAERVGVYGRLPTATTSSTRETIYTDTCIPLKIVGETNSGMRAGFVPGTEVTLTSTDTSGRFYYDNLCANPAAGSASTKVGQESELYYKTTTSGAVSFSVNASANIAGLSAGTYYGTISATSAPAKKVVLKAPDQVYAYSCFPIDLVSIDSTTGALANLTSASYWQLSSPNLEFYGADGSCSGAPTSTQSFSPGTQQTLYRAFARYVGASASMATLVPTFGGGQAGLAIEGKSVNFMMPGAPSRLMLMMPMSISSEQCVQATVQLTDASGYPVLNTSGTGIPVSVSASSGQFYTVANCYGGYQASPSEMIAVGTTGKNLWYKPGALGSATVSVSHSIAPAAYAGTSLNVNVIAAVANRVRVVLPGQSWDPMGNYATGVPWAQVRGFDVPIELYAVTQANNLDLAFNRGPGEFNFSSTTPFTFFFGPMWTSGHAVLGLRFEAESLSTAITTGGGASGLYPENPPLLKVLEARNIKLRKSTGFYQNHCQPILLQLTSAYDESTLLTRAPVTVDVFEQSSAATFYSSPDCNGGTEVTSGSPALNWARGESQKLIYTKISTSSFTLQANEAPPNSLGLVATSASGSAGSGTVGAASSVSILGAGTFSVGICQGFALQISDSAGNAVAPASAATVQLTTTSGADGKFWDNPDCTAGGAATKSITLSAPEKAVMFYYRAHNASAHSILLNGSASGLSGGPFEIAPVN